MVRIVTPRLEIVAAEPGIARAEADDVQGWCAPLGVAPPRSWPPPLLDAETLRWLAVEIARTRGRGWYSWYVLRREPRALIGSAGFKGRPDQHGSVEIGYSLLGPFQGQGLGTELVRGLTGWAFRHGTVERVMAVTYPELAASVRVLEKNGFAPAGRAPLPGAIRLELRRAVHEQRRASSRGQTPQIPGSDPRSC
jgi:RimJ/RimL family protein N-acetyltransferase